MSRILTSICLGAFLWLLSCCSAPTKPQISEKKQAIESKRQAHPANKRKVDQAGIDENPKRSPEVMVLERFAGTWKGVASVKQGGHSFSVTEVSTREWMVSGHGNFLMEHAVAEPGNQRSCSLFTYDPKKKVYRGVLLNRLGAGILEGNWDEKSQTMSWQSNDNERNTGQISHRFITKDHAEIEIIYKKPDGEVLL